MVTVLRLGLVRLTRMPMRTLLLFGLLRTLDRDRSTSGPTKRFRWRERCLTILLNAFRTQMNIMFRWCSPLWQTPPNVE